MSKFPSGIWSPLGTTFANRGTGGTYTSTPIEGKGWEHVKFLTQPHRESGGGGRETKRHNKF